MGDESDDFFCRVIHRKLVEGLAAVFDYVVEHAGRYDFVLGNAHGKRVTGKVKRVIYVWV